MALKNDFYTIVTNYRHGGLGTEGRIAEELDRQQTVQDIAEGMVSNVQAVIHCNVAEGTCKDVSPEIAREVADYASSNDEPITPDTRDFIEAAAGLVYARGLQTY